MKNNQHLWKYKKRLNYRFVKWKKGVLVSFLSSSSDRWKKNIWTNKNKAKGSLVAIPQFIIGYYQQVNKCFFFDVWLHLVLNRVSVFCLLFSSSVIVKKEKSSTFQSRLNDRYFLYSYCFLLHCQPVEYFPKLLHALFSYNTKIIPKSVNDNNERTFCFFAMWKNFRKEDMSFCPHWIW